MQADKDVDLSKEVVKECPSGRVHKYSQTYLITKPESEPYIFCHACRRAGMKHRFRPDASAPHASIPLELLDSRVLVLTSTEMQASRLRSLRYPAFALQDSYGNLGVGRLDNKLIEGKQIVICMDGDPRGISLAKDVARELRALRVRYLHLETAGPGSPFELLNLQGKSQAEATEIFQASGMKPWTSSTLPDHLQDLLDRLTN